MLNESFWGGENSCDVICFTIKLELNEIATVSSFQSYENCQNVN